jgi:hypothetical protein
MVKGTTFCRRKYRELSSDRFLDSNNTGQQIPAPFNQVPVASTYYLESGDFLRVNNISLGYKVPVAENSFLTIVEICKRNKPIYYTKVFWFFQN